MSRGRPRNALLSPDLIVDTALGILDRGGSLTMSAVARELSVHVSSLYNHVGDRSSLIEHLRLRIAQEHPVPSTVGLTWDAAAVTIATTIRAAFLSHPGLIPYLAESPITSPELIEIYTDLAGRMVDAGLSPEQAALTIRMIDSFALGTALVRSAHPEVWDHVSEGGKALRDARASWENESALTDDAFLQGLHFMLAGIATASNAGAAPESATPTQVS